jgi:hypothetical protein
MLYCPTYHSNVVVPKVAKDMFLSGQECFVHLMAKKSCRPTALLKPKPTQHRTEQNRTDTNIEARETLPGYLVH